MPKQPSDNTVILKTRVSPAVSQAVTAARGLASEAAWLRDLVERAVKIENKKWRRA